MGMTRTRYAWLAGVYLIPYLVSFCQAEHSWRGFFLCSPRNWVRPPNHQSGETLLQIIKVVVWDILGEILISIPYIFQPSRLELYFRRRLDLRNVQFNILFGSASH